MEKRKDFGNIKRIETFCVKLESGDKSIELNKSGNVLIDFNKLDFTPPDSVNKVVVLDGSWFREIKYFWNVETKVLHLSVANLKLDARTFKSFWIYFYSVAHRRDKIINDLLEKKK